MNNKILSVEKKNIENINIINNTIDIDDIKSNEKDDVIVIKIDKFAVTSNNITYAAIGEAYYYFDFFKLNDNDIDNQYGIVPCWGLATVLYSNCDAIKEGQRFYGFLPMSNYAVFKPSNISKRGFSVKRDWVRMKGGDIYNNYNFCDNDPLYLKKELEEYMCIFRPLFITALMLQDYIAINHKDIKNVILTSASSKTSLSLAYLLKTQQNRAFKVSGLTSAKNMDYVKSLGLYDNVFQYDQCNQLPQTSSVVVDIAGNNKVQTNIATHLKDNLIHILIVGMSHWNQTKVDSNDEDKKVSSSVFFAPAWYLKREKELGTKEMGALIVKGWVTVNSVVGNWMKIKSDDVKACYTTITQGKSKPNEAFVTTLNVDSHL